MQGALNSASCVLLLRVFKAISNLDARPEFQQQILTCVHQPKIHGINDVMSRWNHNLLIELQDLSGDHEIPNRTITIRLTEICRSVSFSLKAL